MIVVKDLVSEVVSADSYSNILCVREDKTNHGPRHYELDGGLNNQNMVGSLCEREHRADVCGLLPCFRSIRKLRTISL